MSAIHEASLHPSTVESMRLNDGRCGCERRGSKWWLCQYHQGYDDGASAPLHDRYRRAVADEAARRVCSDGVSVYSAVTSTIRDLPPCARC